MKFRNLKHENLEPVFLSPYFNNPCYSLDPPEVEIWLARSHGNMSLFEIPNFGAKNWNNYYVDTHR